jgi:hypothetical protein
LITIYSNLILMNVDISFFIFKKHIGISRFILNVQILFFPFILYIIYLMILILFQSFSSILSSFLILYLSKHSPSFSIYSIIHNRHYHSIKYHPIHSFISFDYLIIIHILSLLILLHQMNNIHIQKYKMPQPFAYNSINCNV